MVWTLLDLPIIPFQILQHQATDPGTVHNTASNEESNDQRDAEFFVIGDELMITSSFTRLKDYHTILFNTKSRFKLAHNDSRSGTMIKKTSHFLFSLQILKVRSLNTCLAKS